MFVYRICVRLDQQDAPVILRTSTLIWQIGGRDPVRQSRTSIDASSNENENGVARGLFKKSGGTYTHHVLLESLREFFHAYAYRPRFSLTFFSELIHDNPAYATLLDDDLVTLLRQIQVNDEQDFLFDEPKPFSNTIVILFADHGPRLGGARLSVQGKLEERLPLLSFILPKRFSTDWPEAFAQLRANRDRLVTLFDVHATLKHILIRQYGDHLDSVVKSPRGISLFTPIPENRTCAQASIAPHWCVCLQWSDIRVRSLLNNWPPVVYTAANHILSHVNHIVQRINSHRGMSSNVQKCQKMVLSK
ncbi:hypothetical protein CSKR_112755, partial [Clonorchis sinensis]